MRSLPIGPEDAFVLSRVDGRMTELDIAAATGLSAGAVREKLTRLSELGAVHFDGPAEPVEQEPDGDRPSMSGMRLSRPVVEQSEPHLADAHPAAALYDPAELDEEVDLSLQHKRMILDRFYRLDAMNHYELLDIDEGAERKAIKEAYFHTVASFHPDRYYGKNLGSFKHKLERVFARLTEAHDTLTRNKLREQYDRYLIIQRKSRDMERGLTDKRSQQAQMEEARRELEMEARIAERARAMPRPPDPDARRRALARRLRGSSGPPARASTPPPPSSQRGAVQEMVADELRKRYEQRVTDTRKQQVEHYIAQAEEALSTRNVVGAANALRIALSLTPGDQELASRLEEVQTRANTELADTYLDQARYEEQTGRFLEAARSYERAARGKPTPVVYERAARCLLQAEADLRRAADLAKKAAEMAPKAPEPRVTLAKIYVRAKMQESALMEFERALQLSPDDDSIKDWIKRLKKGEA